MTKVSVVIPVYNVGEYLEDSLFLLLNQTLEDIEIICVNDGSTDNSQDILEKLAKNNTRIKIVNQENCGAGIARNKGAEIAQGEYIHFIDADDIVSVDMLEKLYTNAISNQSDFVVFKAARFNDTEISYKHPIYNLENVFENVDFNNFTFNHLDIKKNVLNISFAPWTKFYKREFLENNNLRFPDISSYNDILFHVQSMLKASKISFVPEFLYYYRLDNVHSITNDFTKHCNIFKVIDSVEDFLIGEDFIKDYQKEFDRFKVVQISRHMTIPINEKYYIKAKEEFSKIDVSNNKLFKKVDLEKYHVTQNLQVEEIDRFADYLKLKNLQNKNHDLTKHNGWMNKKVSSEKELNDAISHSSSWRLMGPVRAIKNHSFKESLLNKSNSYVHYKNGYKKLNKDKKNLIRKYDKLEADNKKLFDDKNQLSDEKNELINIKNDLTKEKNQLIEDKMNLINDKNSLIEEKNNVIDENNHLNNNLNTLMTYINNIDSLKVSVIIPVYNVEKYLKECLDSVVNQTLKDIEIICVNDGSTDNSLSILEDYAKFDDRIKIFSKENGGQSSARNYGLKKASGDYIYFIDADDYIKLDMLEKLYYNAIFNDSEIVISKIARFEDKSNEIDYSNPGYAFDNIFNGVNFNDFSFNYNDIKKYVLNSSFAPWMKLFKRDFLVDNGFYFVENIVFEDVLFHIQTFLNAKRISFSPNYYYYYRNNPSSTMNTSENGFDIFKVINLVETYLKNSNYYYEFENEFYLFKATQILNYILSTDSEEYFQIAKEKLSKIMINNNELIYFTLEEKIKIVLNSNNLMEYKKNLSN